MQPTRNLTARLSIAALVGIGSIGGVALTATPALAAGTDAYLSVNVYPADLYNDGTETTPSTDTGSYYGEYYQQNGSGSGVDTHTEQVRGATVVNYDSGWADKARTVRAPVSIQAGDSFRVVRDADNAVLASGTYSGAPSLAASTCVGSLAFSGTRDAGALVDRVSIQRRVTRTYTPTGDYGPQNPVTTKGFEPVAFAAPDAISGTTFSGAFPGVPQAGDYLTASESTTSIANDVQTSFNVSVTRPAAACPPAVVTGTTPGTTPTTTPAKDRTAPSISKLKPAKPKVAKYLKSGLTTTLTINEAGTVVQGLYLPNGKKVPASVRAKAAKKAKKKVVLVGKGRKTSKVAGKVTVTIKPTKAAKTTLKGKKSFKLKLVTTVRDAAGNARSKTVSVTVKR